MNDLTLLRRDGRYLGKVEKVESVAWLAKSRNRASNFYLLLLLFNVRSLIDLTTRQLSPNAIMNCGFYNILCVTEAWLVPDVADSVLFLNKFYINKNDWQTTNGRSKLGGAIIAVNASILHARVTLPGYYTDTVAIRIETLDQSFLTVCIYNAPKKQSASIEFGVNKIFSWENCTSELRAMLWYGHNNWSHKFWVHSLEWNGIFGALRYHHFRISLQPRISTANYMQEKRTGCHIDRQTKSNCEYQRGQPSNEIAFLIQSPSIPDEINH